MQVTAVSVTAGRKSQHPTEPFANILVSATYTATLDSHDDRGEATRFLQREADKAVEAEKRRIIDSLIASAPTAPSKAQTATEATASSLLAKHKGK